MKKTFTLLTDRISVVAAALLLVTACTKESLPEPAGGDNPPTVPETPTGQYVSFVAGAPAAEDETRAGYDSATGHAVWESGDRIGVFVAYMSANANTLFTQKTGTLSADGRTVEYEGTFSTVVTGNKKFYAVYPYDSGATISGTTLTTTFPGRQVYSPAGYTGIPLLGKYEGDIANLHLGFKNPFAVIELRLASESPVNVTHIVFQGNNHETVSGTIQVNMSGERPAVSFTAFGTSKSITLDCGEGVALTSEPKSFYIAIPVQEYTKGYRFDIRTDREGANAVVLNAKSGGVTPVANTIYGTPVKTLATTDFKHIIPDANFRNWLASNGWVTVDDETTGAVTIVNTSGTWMNMDAPYVSSLKGIEYFPQLTYLRCYSNQLTELDVTKNTNLTFLQCSHNQLTELDVTQNKSLTELSCDNNQLTSLDVTQNTNLGILYCFSNRLTSLDVKQNRSLTTLSCYTNQLTELDVKQNTELTTLKCYSNRLTSLDVTKNMSLIELECYSNQLTSLDVTQNTSLTKLLCYSNQLTSLNVTQNESLTELRCYSNQLTELDVTQNTSLNSLLCYSNRLKSLDASKMMANYAGWYEVYCGKQTDADGNAITLQLTLREQQRSRWDGVLKSYSYNDSVAEPIYVPNP